jgi:LSD1 subclass zinc finger protein
MPEAAASPLAVLGCRQCGAAVALGDGDELSCRGCGALVPVPAAHRALRDQLRSDAGAVAAAEKLYMHLLRPAPPWQRALASPWRFAVTLLVLCLAAGVALVLLGPRVDAWLSLRLGARLRDTWGSFSIIMFHTALLLLAASPWLVLVVGERRAAARVHLRAELAAAPPAVAGGERGCRSCGAPLVVPDGARGARCPYCRADNLVQGSDDLQRRVAHRGNHVAGVVGDARLLAAWESVWLRRSLIVRLGVFAVLFCLAATVDVLRWRTLRTLGFAEALQAREARESLKLDAGCHEANCISDLHRPHELALRKGERLRLRVIAIPDGDELARVTVHVKSSDAPIPVDWPILADSELRAGEDLIAQAPLTGWYAWEFAWRRERTSYLASETELRLRPSIVEAVIEP